MIGSSAVLVWFVPRSILAFMAFQASLLVIYLVPISMRAKLGWAVITLGIVMPTLGTHNAYYMEVAIQVGIFVALALGLKIVVGLAGLLDLGYVAFYALGAYRWAIFGSTEASKFVLASIGALPLSSLWLFLF